MSFSSYKSLGETVKEFQVTYTTANFITGVAFKIPDGFREDLQFMMQEGVVDNSEYAICENSSPHSALSRDRLGIRIKVSEQEKTRRSSSIQQWSFKI